MAPTDPLSIVHSVAKASWRSLDVMLGGLIPNWAKDIKSGFSTFNARAEEVDSKPAFREAFRQRLCLMALALVDRRLMALAGLSESWRSPADERVRSFTILTKTLNELCAELHNRMTVFLKLVVSLEAGY